MSQIKTGKLSLDGIPHEEYKIRHQVTAKDKRPGNFEIPEKPLQLSSLPVGRVKPGLLAQILEIV